MRRVTVLILAAWLAIFAVACGPLTISPVVSQPNPKQLLIAEFEKNLATWQGSGITHYAFTYQPSCFCLTDPHLVVNDGTEIRIDGAAAAGTVSPVGAPVGVDGLFEIVRRAIKGDQASIGYDPKTGVPVSMRSDPMLNAVDDELSFEVTDWTLDPPNDDVLGDITRARSAWNGHGLRSYSWTIRIDCDCTDKNRRFDITVKDGDVSVRSGGNRISTDNLEGVPLTVPALFDVAAHAATTAHVRAEFDASLGFPTLVEIRDDRPEAVTSERIEIVAFSVP